MGCLMSLREIVRFSEGPRNLKIISLINPKAPGFGCSTVGQWTLMVTFENYLNVVAWVRKQVEAKIVQSAQLVENEDILDEGTHHVVVLTVKGYLNRDGLTMMMREFQRLELDSLVMYIDLGPLKGRRAHQQRRALYAPNPFAPIIEFFSETLHRQLPRVQPMD